jgi:ABC-type phosphate/phosphonate transport system substrate-binding protein
MVGRHGLDPALVAKVRAALLQIRGPDHQAMLAKMYDIDGFEPAEDSEYEVVRAAMDLVGLKPR